MTFVEVVERGESPRPYPVPVASIIGGHVILFGYSIKESTGNTAAELDIFDGTSSSASMVIPVPLGPGQSTEEWFGPQGVHLRGGLFSAVIAGQVVGSLFVHLVGSRGGD